MFPYTGAEVGISGKLARSRLAQLANASQLGGLFLSSLPKLNFPFKISSTEKIMKNGALVLTDGEF